MWTLIIIAVGLVYFLNEITNTYYKVEFEEGKEPYSFEIINDSNSSKQAILFGMNFHLLSKNNGSDNGLKIIPKKVNAYVGGVSQSIMNFKYDYSELSYVELLQKSVKNPFRTSCTRIETDTVDQIKQILCSYSEDANGSPCIIPVATQSYLSKDVFEQNKLDVPYPFVFDGNSDIKINILPKSKSIYTFVPVGETKIIKTSILKDFMNQLKK